MAYGMLAELPAINGLYTSFFPPLLYFLLGTSRHISLGTMAVVALMSGAATETVAQRFNEQRGTCIMVRHPCWLDARHRPLPYARDDPSRILTTGHSRQYVQREFDL